MTYIGTQYSRDHVLKGTTEMTRKLFLLAGMVVTLTGGVCLAQPAPQGEAFDVLGAVMDNSRIQLSAKQVLNRNKEDAEAFREKIIAGWWEFMQANSKARPGEYCAAMFQRARREAHPGGIDLFTAATTVTLFGPGGDYRGALLAFSPLANVHQFPKLQNGQKVLITLKQGDELPQTLNALYFTLGKSAAPMIAFAVPSVDALLASIEEQARFELHYQGRPIANIEWHSGFKARDGLQACLKGKR